MLTSAPELGKSSESLGSTAVMNNENDECFGDRKYIRGFIYHSTRDGFRLTHFSKTIKLIKKA